MSPWKNKNQNMIQAQKHVENMNLLYENDIKDCIKTSIIYSGQPIPKFNIKNPTNTEIILDDTDSVSALYSCNENDIVAVLNFASYKNPGGGFMAGAMTQEEALCHESILYNVISNQRFKDKFYAPNRKRLHKALYNDNLIYTPNVTFIRNNKIMYADVITCAAPNKGVAVDICNVNENAVNEKMQSRIQHALYSALDNSVEIVILGAFGCGVFKNDPNDVATLFKYELDTTFKGAFDKVIFAVPNKGRGSKNYRAFKEILFN